MTTQSLLENAWRGNFVLEVLAHIWLYLRQSWLPVGLAFGPLFVLLPALLENWYAGPAFRTRNLDEYFYLCVVVGALYALAFGAMSFAGEHESKTETFLRSLPVRTDAFITGVFLAGVLGTVLTLVMSWVLMAGVILLVTGTLSGGLFGSIEASLALIYWIGLCAGFLAWGIFFSLILRRVIWAAILAAFVTYGLDVLVTVILSPETGFTWERAAELSGPRLLLILLVFSVDIGLIRQWLGPSPTGIGTVRLKLRDSRLAHLLKSVSRPATLLARPLFRARPIPKSSYSTGDVLLWLHTSQVRPLDGIMRLLGILTLMLLAVVMFDIPARLFSADTSTRVSLAVLGLVLTELLVLEALTGVYTFGPDRWFRTGRFLATLPVSPGEIWRSRQRWGVRWFLTWTVLLGVTWSLHLRHWSAAEVAPQVGNMVLFGIALYTTGQALGMAFPTVFLAVVATFLVAWLGTFLPISLWPIGPDETVPGLGSLLCAVVFSGAMLWESRRSLRPRLEEWPPAPWIRRFSSPAITALVLLWAVWPWCRVFFIPKADPQARRQLETTRRINVAEFCKPISEEERQGCKTTARLSGLIPSTVTLTAWRQRYTESQVPYEQAWRDFAGSPGFGEALKIVAEIPRMDYADPSAKLVCPDIPVFVSDREMVVGIDHTLPSSLTTLAVGATRCGETETAAKLLKAAFCLELRLDRTYPWVFGFPGGLLRALPEFADSPYSHWADAVWEWSHAQGQTAESLRLMLRELQQIHDRERIPMELRLVLISEYWRKAFLRDTDYGLGLAGPRVSWWPPGMWALVPSVRLLPGEWQLYRARCDRIAAEYLLLAKEWETTDMLPAWFLDKLYQTEPRPVYLEMPVSFTAATELEQMMMNAFARRLAQEIYFRATILRLAIRAFQLEHGRYPLRLEELVPHDLPEVPVMPGTGRAFRLHFPQKVFGDPSLPAAPSLMAPGGPTFPLEPPAPQPQDTSCRSESSTTP